MKELFEKHQRILTSVADHPIGRKLLGIPQKGRIARITPNSTSVIQCFDGKNLEIETLVRGSNKYSQKLSTAFKVGSKFGGALAEGLRYFSSPENYIPIPLFLGSTTVTDRDDGVGDCEFQEDSAWETAWAASASNAINTTGTAPFVRAATGQIKRGYIPWSVAGEPATGVASSGHIDLYTSAGFEDPDSDSLGMSIATPTTPGTPVVGDYSKMKGTEVVNRQTFANIGDGSYHEWALNATGLTYLSNSFGGIFDVGLASRLDYDHGTPTGAGDIGWATSETANDPHLTFTYTIPPLTKDNSEKSNTLTTYYCGRTYDWKIDGVNRGFNS